MELDLKNYNYEVRHVRTLNECINSLIQGYAGTVLPCDLEKYFVELVQDECFFRYPLIRYMYAHILLVGYWVADDYRMQCCVHQGEDRELAKEILMPLAQEGLAPAQYDIANWFYFTGDDMNEQAQWFLMASRQDYPPAVKKVEALLALGVREKLSNETVKTVCTEVVRTCEGSYSKEFATDLLKKMEKEEAEKNL